eukprot:353301-Chlamydomonas_euryale.AAC.5
MLNSSPQRRTHLDADSVEVPDRLCALAVAVDAHCPQRADVATGDLELVHLACQCGQSCGTVKCGQLCILVQSGQSCGPMKCGQMRGKALSTGGGRMTGDQHRRLANDRRSAQAAAAQDLKNVRDLPDNKKQVQKSIASVHLATTAGQCFRHELTTHPSGHPPLRPPIPLATHPSGHPNF